MTEVIIVSGVHSAGQNSIEQSGMPNLLEIAEYLSKISKECIRSLGGHEFSR
ncbi:MAG: hypothetical protein HZB24_02135 [Desulfobacterales bacterium]|nr:hypothetical protein [Desulfobacterales bacterium]